MARIKKLKENNKSYYPATIALAVKDANFKKSDNSIMTLSEINSKISQDLQTALRFVILTLAEYDSLTNKLNNVAYLISDYYVS